MLLPAPPSVFSSLDGRCSNRHHFLLPSSIICEQKESRIFSIASYFNRLETSSLFLKKKKRKEAYRRRRRNGTAAMERRRRRGTLNYRGRPFGKSRRSSLEFVWLERNRRSSCVMHGRQIGQPWREGVNREGKIDSFLKWKQSVCVYV